MRETPASNLPRQVILDYAERIGEHYKAYGDGGYADIHRLVEDLGGTVDVSPSLFGEEALTVRRARDFTVHLPPATSDRRDRFTIAHELGHYFLHYLYPLERKLGRIEEGLPTQFGRGSRGRAETEANYFAASLLMPRRIFAKAYAEERGDITALAARFGVSPRAAEVRADFLGLSTS